MPEPLATTEKVIYLTAGAGGMFCGSCMHDNAISRALAEHGWDIQLVATYTPIRTDEEDFSVDQVLFGGLNVYLQQKIPLLRYLPAFLDRFLNSPWLIRKVTSKAMETSPQMLGKLALSMLQGERGNQRKEVREFCKWLTAINPKLVIFSNVLIGGSIQPFKKQSSAKVLVTLQGDNVFLDSLREPYRSRCIDRIKEIAESVDGFIVQSYFFRDLMSDYFSIEPERFIVVPLGLEVADFRCGPVQHTPSAGRDASIGYLARLAPEKGLHHLVDAFIELKRDPQLSFVKLKIAGWISPEHQAYAQQQFDRLIAAKLENEFEYAGVVDREQKLALLRSLDVFSVPTDYQEPKGRYALEAMACGLPVVLPDQGAFTELIESSAGGVLVAPRDSSALADQLVELLQDHDRRNQLGHAGHRYVLDHRNAQVMARQTADAIEAFLGSR